MSSFNENTINSNPWVARIALADKAFKAWESKFDCVRLYDYYENFQWKARTDSPQLNYRPYTLNLIYSTIKIKLASFLFQKPEFLVTPEPGHSHWDLDTAVQSAQIKQDTLNTVAKNRNVKFARHLKYCALDSFFWFGLMEVGYAADWRNPIKEDPYLNSWDDEDTPEDKVRVKENLEVPVNERAYIKRIKPQRFRVSVSDAEDLEDFEWCGYWQYYYIETLKHTPGIKFPEEYSGSIYSVDNIGSYSRDSQSGLYLPPKNNGSICKVWHIWDSIAKKRRMILDGYNREGYELWTKPFEKLPLIDLRWELRKDGFYPIPPVWYWLASQDEINESREQIRSYRRRFTRKFQAIQGQVDTEEVEKFVAGPDGIVVFVKQPNAISAIDNPEIGPTSENALVQAKDDFNLISGTSAEARGQNADRETATAAKIVNDRSQIRESVDQLDFSIFATDIGREMLTVLKENLVEGLWIKYSSDPDEGVLTDMKVNMPLYKFIKAQDLNDGYDYTIDVDIKNATPAAMQAEQTAFVNFIMFVQNAPMIAASPVLIREAAYRFGYKNEKVIHQMQQVAMLSMAAKAAQAGATGQQIMGAAAQQENGGGSNSADVAKAQMAQPDAGTIQHQISQQLQ